MMPLVSIVIPCFNAERWLNEAIDSCLAQEYIPIEIIVVDDGSTDGSKTILRNYGEEITLLTGPNKGGNYARNQGFRASRGKYLQFLDADDYLLPEKIWRQVQFLEDTGADVVYGDWRHQFHEDDGRVWQDDIHKSGEQVDVLAALLSGWWVAPAAVLWRRGIIESCGGWDEALKAGQDKDFFISIAMAGADIRYQPNCHSIYRRYGKVTVSTASRRLWLESHQLILEKAERQLRENGLWKPAYQKAVARSYFHLARNQFAYDRAVYDLLLERVLALDPDFQPQESVVYNVVQRFLGFVIADQLAGYLHALRSRRRAVD